MKQYKSNEIQTEALQFKDTTFSTTIIYLTCIFSHLFSQLHFKNTLFISN